MQTELFESFEDSTDILSVSQLTKEIKSLLETSLPPLWVRGEISNLHVQSSGHRYFILKDQNSQLKTVLFKGNFQNSGYVPSDGDECLAYGNINVYEPRGDYQFRVKHIMQDGTGMLRLQFDRLKEKLLADGIFDDHNKTPLPDHAQNIAIITSSKGAALQDFLSILNRKKWTGKISVFPSSVQGKDAPSELLHSLKLIEKYQHYDLVVLARGGGSIEDLWAFNDESLVRSVADFNMPIISAIGHQTDFVLTDFASDFRAETPSAAAEWICNLQRNQLEHLNNLANQLADLPKRKIEQHTEKLNLATIRLRNCSPKSKVEVFHQYLDEFSNRMDTRILHTIDQNKLKVSSLGKRLESNSLKSVLNRGFAFFEGQDGKTLENATMLKKGDTVKAVFKDGKKDLEVKN